LPTASSRFHLTMDTLAVQLTLPLAGCVGDLHPQVSAPCRAHRKKDARYAASACGPYLWCLNQVRHTRNIKRATLQAHFQSVCRASHVLSYCPSALRWRAKSSTAQTWVKRERARADYVRHLWIPFVSLYCVHTITVARKNLYPCTRYHRGIVKSVVRCIRIVLPWVRTQELMKPREHSPLSQCSLLHPWKLSKPLVPKWC
jgi:hypothetical protein